VNFIKIGLIHNIYKTIEKLRESGFSIIGADTNGKTQLYEYNFPDKSVIIFGNEGEGIRKNITKLCDNVINIPIKGKVESLNVSVSAGIVLFEMLRQRNY
jgi:23S rRNA (guanosine2251-2'-O)-methyltransferase